VNSLLQRLGEVRHVQESGDVDGELKKDREEDVEVKDVGERSFPGKFLDGLERRNRQLVSKTRLDQSKRGAETNLGSRDAEEADTHEHSGDGDLEKGRREEGRSVDRFRLKEEKKRLERTW